MKKELGTSVRMGFTPQQDEVFEEICVQSRVGNRVDWDVATPKLQEKFPEQNRSQLVRHWKYIQGRRRSLLKSKEAASETITEIVEPKETVIETIKKSHVLEEEVPPMAEESNQSHIPAEEVPPTYEEYNKSHDKLATIIPMRSRKTINKIDRRTKIVKDATISPLVTNLQMEADHTKDKTTLKKNTKYVMGEQISAVVTQSKVYHSKEAKLEKLLGDCLMKNNALRKEVIFWKQQAQKSAAELEKLRGLLSGQSQAD